MIPAQGLRSHVHDDIMVRSGAYGAFDSPLPFHSTTVAPATLNPQHSALNPQPSNLNPTLQPFNPQPSFLNP